MKLYIVSNSENGIDNIDGVYTLVTEKRRRFIFPLVFI